MSRQHFRYNVPLFFSPDLLRLTVLTSLFFLQAWPDALIAQNISGIVNRYAAVSAYDTCSGFLTLSDTTGFRKNQGIYLIQMKGAVISEENNATFGQILALNQCGKFERAHIDSVGANGVFLRNRLLNAYQFSSRVQAVSIAQYQQVTVADTLRAAPWNGITGGILALEVSDTLQINAPIMADACGYRGAQVVVPPTNNCTWLIGESAYFYAPGNWRGAAKGEGIAEAQNSRSHGRGAQANGGGGGNDHNSGGGGGGLFSAGGKGGNNDEPATLGCDGYFPGVGGRALAYAADRLFPGGGGGAGHSNNGLAGKGGAGGGIVLVKAGHIRGTFPLISSNGADGGTGQGDGGAGAGAGGIVWVDCQDAGSLQIRADGGRGGNTLNLNADRCFGPGGGGAGGCISSNIPGLIAPAGGDPGKVTASTNACNGSASAAEKGENGMLQPLFAMPTGELLHNLPQITAQPLADTICPGEAALLFVETNMGAWSYQWQFDDGSGWKDLSESLAFQGVQNDSLILNQALFNYRCKVFRPSCFETYSLAANIFTRPLPTADFSVNINSSTGSFASTATEATGFLWNFGDPATGPNNSSTQPNAQHTFSAEGEYVVKLTVFSLCDTLVVEKTVSILLPPTADFEVPGMVQGCNAFALSMTNLSSANSDTYLWACNGATPGTSSDKEPVFSFSNSGTYSIVLTVSNAAGSSTKTRIIQVSVFNDPTAAFSSTINNLNVQFNNQSQNATQYRWDFGDGNSSNTANPTHNYIQDGQYTVTLTAWNICDTVSISQTLNLLLAPVAGFLIPDSLSNCGPATIQPVNQSTGSNLSYLWSIPGATPQSSTQANPGFTLNVSGVYTLSQTVSNALGSDQFEQSIVVNIQNTPVAQFSITPMGNGAFQFENLSQNGASFTWDFGDGSGFSTTAEPTHQYAQSGSYIVTLIAGNSCGASIYQLTVQVMLSDVENMEDGSGIRIFPNPNQGEFIVSLPEDLDLPEVLCISMTDVHGKLGIQELYANPPLNIPLKAGNFSSGIYTLKLSCSTWSKSLIMLLLND